MKIMIQGGEANGADNSYQLWAEVTDCAIPADHKLVKFTSVWEKAHDPAYARTQFECILSPAGLASLQQLLAQV